MATYNCADTLARALDSILAQTFTDWEFVICDDCSTDGTYSILLNYQRNHPGKFRILKNDQNSKLAFSLNRCLGEASGEFIARMDGVSKRTERGQDLDLWFRFFAKGFSGNNLDDVLYKVCEDRAALKRRKFKYDLYMTQTRYLGFRLLHFAWWKYPLVLKPIVSFFTPRQLKLLWRRNTQ